MALIGAATALVAATIIAPAVATPAAAAEITRTPQAKGPDIISIRGKIDADDHKKFIEIASDSMLASVILNSRGGDTRAAIIIGRFIHLRNYETRVHNGAVCDSACTLIWLAGTFRHLDRQSRLGFHSAAMSWQQPYKRNEPANAAIAAYMAGMGVPQQVIDLQPKADPCCLNYVEYVQAKAWGLLSDRPAKQQQALPTPKTQEPGSQQDIDLAKAGICRCVNGQLLPSECKGTCLGSICLGYCKPHTPVAEQSRKQLEFGRAKQQELQTPAAEQPATTAPAAPKIKMLVVRPVTPSPELMPQQAPSTSAPGAQLIAPSVSADDPHPASTYNALTWATQPTDLTQRRAPALPEAAKPDPAVKVEEAPIAARPKITDRLEPGGQQAPVPAAPALGPQPEVTAAQKVVLYEEDPTDPNGKRFVGSVIWRTAMVDGGWGSAAGACDPRRHRGAGAQARHDVVAAPQHRQGAARYPHDRSPVQVGAEFSRQAASQTFPAF